MKPEELPNSDPKDFEQANGFVKTSSSDKHYRNMELNETDSTNVQETATTKEETNLYDDNDKKVCVIEM